MESKARKDCCGSILFISTPDAQVSCLVALSNKLAVCGGIYKVDSTF
jgi:hypothetical protein